MTDKPKEQLQEVWKYFNVTSIDKFVFSRCVECNRSDFLSIPGNVAVKIAENLAKLNQNKERPELLFDDLKVSRLKSQHSELSEFLVQDRNDQEDRFQSDLDAPSQPVEDSFDEEFRIENNIYSTR